MRIPGAASLRQAAKLFTYRFAPRALILHYHRITELATDPHLLCVSPQHFAEQLEVVRKYTRIVRLQHLTQALCEGDLKTRTLVITFDDGYADNLSHAKRLLAQYEIPATVFVTTGYIGHNREFWWDDLDRLLLQPGTLPETLCLRINGAPFQYVLGAAAHYSAEDYQHQRGWNIGQPDEPGPRQHLFRTLWHLMYSLLEIERQKVLDELQLWAGAQPTVRPTHRTLAADEVVQLAAGDGVEVGAHTVTHPVLSSLTIEEQRDEIRRSKADLEELLGRSVLSFSYPHGLRSTYTGETVTLVQESGFTCACTSLVDGVQRGSDCLQLPRVLIRDWDGDEFARYLWAFFRG